MQKSLAQIVVFNRVFSLSILFCLATYLCQLNFSSNIFAVAFLLFGTVMFAFYFLLVEIIGQIIKRKSILTKDICVWLGKVISVSALIVITILCLSTGSMSFASLYFVPVLIGLFYSDSRTIKYSIGVIVFLLLLQHTGLAYAPIFVNNIVSYEPVSLLQAISVVCMLLLARIIVTNRKQVSHKTNILQSMATTDMLTGLINRRYFDRRLIEEIARAKRHNSNLTLAMFDIDHFKRINDTYGHTVGDKVLKELGTIILNNTRESDVSARYGGEEFALILPETTQIEASDLLERIRELVANYAFVKDDSPLMVTISVGIAQYQPDYNLEAFIEQADACLYQAKNTGRNRVVYGSFTKPKLNLKKLVNYAESTNN
ncbi:MAG: GGDEF domain-containing protein [Vampirovibrionia bacterium]